MRCEEVIEELAAPTDMRDAASLAIHLSRCPYCAAWAKRAAKLDNLWQRTAPTAPAPHVWDILWSSVTSSLDSSADKEIASSTVLVSRNGSANGFLVRPETKLVNRPFSPSVRSRRWKVIGLVELRLLPSCWSPGSHGVSSSHRIYLSTSGCLCDVLAHSFAGN